MRAKLHWWYYYHITRRKQRFVPWIAHHMPKRVKYWVIIDAMAHHTVVVDPNCHPDEVQAWHLLRAMDGPGVKKDSNDISRELACIRFHAGEECVPGQNHPGESRARS